MPRYNAQTTLCYLAIKSDKRILCYYENRFNNKICLQALINIVISPHKILVIKCNWTNFKCRGNVQAKIEDNI
jgi:hypothetical protein